MNGGTLIGIAGSWVDSLDCCTLSPGCLGAMSLCQVSETRGATFCVFTVSTQRPSQCERRSQPPA